MQEREQQEKTSAPRKTGSGNSRAGAWRSGATPQPQRASGQPNAAPRRQVAGGQGSQKGSAPVKGTVQGKPAAAGARRTQPNAASNGAESPLFSLERPDIEDGGMGALHQAARQQAATGTERRPAQSGEQPQQRPQARRVAPHTQGGVRYQAAASEKERRHYAANGVASPTTSDLRSYRRMRDDSGKGGRKRPPKKRRSGRWVALGVTLVLVVALGLGGLWILRRPGVAAVASSSSALAEPVSSLSPIASVESSEPTWPTTGNYDIAGEPILINLDNPIPDDYTAYQDRMAVNDTELQTPAALAFLDMQAAAAEEGLSLVAVSGYRSHEIQVYLFDMRMQEQLNKGLSEEEAYAEVARFTAPPGTSEHEAGLAVDINVVEEYFEDSAEFDWLQIHAREYGFIMRYPKPDEHITRIGYEPWHYRFVGTNHSYAIWEQSITLEEYLGAWPV